jgi:HSP20 family protein
MAKEKRSFFERLTGTINTDEETKPSKKIPNETSWVTEEAEAKEAELTVDVYQTQDSIVVKAMIAGVRPDDLDVSITRDAVTIRGTREEERTAREDDYFVKELYWGSFTRTIQLPEEIDVDEAEAIEKHGLLIIKMPKLDKRRQSKLKVRPA